MINFAIRNDLKTKRETAVRVLTTCKPFLRQVNKTVMCSIYEIIHICTAVVEESKE